MSHADFTIKTFAWRLIRRALATGDRAARYTKNININQNCNSCGQIENDAHLFFHCHLPKAVWFSSSPALITDNLPIEDDGVQQILTSFIDDSTPDDLLSKIFITLWFLWKARNDNRFQRKIWTPNQVHNAVKAYTEAATPTLQKEQQELENPTQPIGMAIHNPCISNLTVSIPASLAGPRCYVDASTLPDQNHPFIRPAGIGIFFIDVQVQPPIKILVKARVEQVSSVLMAEAAAAALAAQLLHLLQAQNSYVLSDCQQLVLFLNHESVAHPPDWRMKPFTLVFKNFADAGGISIRKIHRSSNLTAHSLATQASRLSAVLPRRSCSSTAHNQKCPSRAAAAGAVRCVGRRRTKTSMF